MQRTQLIAIASARRNAHRLRRLELREHLQRLEIDECHVPLVDRDQPFRAQLPQRAIEVRHAQAERVAHHLLGERERKGVGVGEADQRQPGMNLQQEVREPFGRRAAPDIDDVLRAIGRLLGGEPAEQQPELRLPVAQIDVGLQRANLQRHVGDGDDGIGGAAEKTARQPDHVSRQHEIDDLPLAVAQQLVAGGIAVLDEAELAEFVAVEHEVAALGHGQLGFDHRTQAAQIGRVEVDQAADARDDGVVTPNRLDGATRPPRWGPGHAPGRSCARRWMDPASCS